MPDERAVTLLAQALSQGRLMHPGHPDRNEPARLITIPGLISTRMPEQMSRFASDAGLPGNDAPTLVAEAILHTIEAVVDRAEPDHPQPDRADVVVNVHCRCNPTEPLVILSTDRSDPEVQCIIDAAEPGVLDVLAAYEQFESPYMVAAHVHQAVITAGSSSAPRAKIMPVSITPLKRPGRQLDR